MSLSAERLYSLLPAVYRVRDEQQGGPLRALMSLIAQEFEALEDLIDGRHVNLPFFVCTGRHVVAELERRRRLKPLEQAGVTVVADTCVVVAPILPTKGGVLMTNSGKFAHYTPANTGYEVVYGSLADCVNSAITGHVTRDEGLWS